MVYFVGDWGMGDTKCATYKHVSKLSPSEDNNQLLQTSTPATTSTTITGNASTTVDHNNRTLTGAVAPLITVPSTPSTAIVAVATSLSSSSSSSLTSLAINCASIKNNEPPQINTQQLQQQTLSLNRATQLIRQRSSSIHQLQHDERHHKIYPQQQQDYDDEVALHPLTNQV